MVGGVPVGEASGIMQDFWSKIGKSITWEEFKRFLRRENPFIVENWLDAIVSREKRLHQEFFTKKFDYSKFFATLEKYGQVKFVEWKKLGLEPHFLPSVEMLQDKKFPGWKVKPENWFFEKNYEGKIFGEPLQLGGGNGQVVLVDIRCKPAYNNGEQMWESDNLLAGIIIQLQAEQKIAYNPKPSRFGISVLEIEQKVVPALATKLGLEPGQVRLERCIEFNVLSQLLTDTPRVRDGETNTWVWFADHFKSDESRLHGGASDGGGFAYVGYGSADDYWGFLSFRLLAVL